VFHACLNIGVCLGSQGKPAAAETFLRRAYEGYATARGSDDRDTLKSLGNLAVSLRLQRKFAQAEPLFREALRKLRDEAGDLHPDTLSAAYSLSLMLLARKSGNDLAEADQILQETLKGRRQILGNTHLDTLLTLYTLGDLRLSEGRPREAEPLFREALASMESVNAGATPTAFSIRLDLSRALKDTGEFAEAESILLETSRALGAAHGAGAGPSRADPCARDFADLYTAWEHAEPGRGYGAKAAEWSAKLAQ
jgi:tetratricopeptide (TPR) repeat protein